MTMNRPFIIAIEGLMASGKTTLFKNLQRKNVLEDTTFIPEPLHDFELHPGNDTIQPLAELYRDPVKNACIFQNYVLDIYDHRMSSMLSNHVTSKTIILERSLDACNVFTNTNADLFSAFGHFYLTDKYCSLRRKYFGNNPISANAIFYIDVSPKEAARRIHERNRKGENNISLSYLEKLEQEYNNYLEFASTYVPVYKTKGETDTLQQFFKFYTKLSIDKPEPIPVYTPANNCPCSVVY